MTEKEKELQKFLKGVSSLDTETFEIYMYGILRHWEKLEKEIKKEKEQVEGKRRRWLWKWKK